MPANLKTQQWTGKGQFSFESQRKAMTKNVQIIIQLHSFHMLARLCSISFKLGFNNTKTENFEMYKLDLEKAEESEIKLTTSIVSAKKQEISRKKSTSALLTVAKAFDCGSQQTVENSERDGNTRPPYLPPEKTVCRSRGNS